MIDSVIALNVPRQGSQYLIAASPELPLLDFGCTLIPFYRFPECHGPP
jgi:hypothetical protein